MEAAQLLSEGLDAEWWEHLYMFQSLQYPLLSDLHFGSKNIIRMRRENTRLGNTVTEVIYFSLKNAF